MPGARFGQPHDRGASRAASPNDGYTRPVHGHACFVERANETRCVGVVADVTIVGPDDRVHRADGTRGGDHVVEQSHDRLLVWHGQVVTVDLGSVLLADCIRQVFRRHAKSLVPQGDPERARGSFVHLR